MKNKYDEIILKYLADLCDEKEIVTVENFLRTDNGFAERFETLKIKSDEMKTSANLEVDNFYFENLIPRARSRKKKFSFNFSFGQLVFPVTSFVVLVMFTLTLIKFSGNTNETNINYSEFLNDFDSTSLELLINSEDVYSVINNSEMDFSEIYLADINFNEIVQDDPMGIYNTNSLLNNLDEAQLDMVLSELKDVSYKSKEK